MSRLVTVAILLTICTIHSRAEKPDIFWPMFGANPARDGNSGVDFSEKTLGKLWSTPQPRITHEYIYGMTGSSPCLISVGDDDMVIVGSYDRNVYAYDAHTGQEIWRFTTGDAVTATPAYAAIDGEPMLYVASSDRNVYALNPADGRRLWTRNVHPWRETIMPSFVGHPMVAEVDGRHTVFVSIYINDLRPAASVQESALYAFDARDGELLWKAPIGNSLATAPAFGESRGEPAIFVIHGPGSVHAYSARDGQPLWDRPFFSEDMIRSGISYAEIDGHRLLFFGSRLYSIFCINADTGTKVWSRSVGTWIDSTPAIYRGAEETTLIFGDYQQFIHGLDALTGRGIWNYRSYGFFFSSPVIIHFQGKPAVVMPCLDDHLYIVGIEDGEFLFRAPLGRFLWTHYQKGEAVWASAAVARLGGREIIAIPFYDGRIHVFAHTGEDANVGPPVVRLVDALGGAIFAWVSGAVIIIALAYNALHLARKRKK